MSYDSILYEKTGRVAYITLNRPEALNAVDAKVVEELKSAFSDFDTDPEVWVAILSGSGRSFCAGADNKQLGRRPKTSSKLDICFLDKALNWKPVIGAIHGHCDGYGLSMAAECDMIVASQDATFSLIEIKYGMLPVTIFAHLSAWIGSKRLTEMILTGDPLFAAEAHRLGLVNDLVSSPDDLLAAADALAARVVRNPPVAVRAAVQLSRTSALQSQIYREAEMLYRNTKWSETDDYKEALAALREQRPPTFTGR